MSMQTQPVSAATQNTCRLCTPFGACLAFRGMENTMPFLHGSQGCATYIRRYIIGHFREPMDIACSNFSEAATIFGGREYLNQALENIMLQYQPAMIGIATTCLAETIGDDINMFLHSIRQEWKQPHLPRLVTVSTASYRGSHADGFHGAVRATVVELAAAGETSRRINLFANIVSPEDLRYLKTIVADFGLPVTLLPDYSDTLDGPSWENYHRIPPGGTPLNDIKLTGRAQASIELGSGIPEQYSAAAFLKDTFNLPRITLPLPVGIRATDSFFRILEQLSGQDTPACHQSERGRLIDAYVDGHKYVFGKKAALYGLEDMVVAMAGLVAEIGMIPVLCASSEQSGRLRGHLMQVVDKLPADTVILENADFSKIEEQIERLQPDMLIGDSNGAKIARARNIPLIRTGLPVHDRLGAARLLHLGYRGTQQLFDRIANAFIELKQESTPVGYTHM